MLSALVLISKAHWGYSATQLDVWRRSLEISEQRLASQPAFVAEDGGVIGFCSLHLAGGGRELDNLWVLPRRMGRGCGRLLLEHAARTARALGVAWIRIDADPHAAAFYVKCGAVIIGEVPAPIDGETHRRRL